MRPDFPENFTSEVKKSTEPCKTETVGIWRYPVFYLTPSELGDLGPEKKVFFPKRVYDRSHNLSLGAWSGDEF